MSAERLDRKVTVILATDVVAYSKHVEQDEGLTIKTYSEREAVLLRLINDWCDIDIALVGCSGEEAFEFTIVQPSISWFGTTWKFNLKDGIVGNPNSPSSLCSH